MDKGNIVMLSPKAQLMSDLIPSIPLNNYGLPVGIYRPDVLKCPTRNKVTDTIDRDIVTVGELIGGDALDLPQEGTNLSTLVPKRHSAADLLTYSELQAAYVPLSYDEGYPTLPNGVPFWSCLPFEEPYAYQVFNAYMEMAEKSDTGVRMTADLPDFALQKYGIQTTLESAREYYYLYYWNARVKAYDLCRAAIIQKQQDLRALQVTNSHYEHATGLMKKLQDYMEDEEEFWDIMTPKTAVDLLKTLASLQRISVGLPAGGPASQKEGQDQRGSSLEVIMRKMSRNIHVDKENTFDGQSGQIIDELLNNPEAVEMAQELIIRMNKGGT